MARSGADSASRERLEVTPLGFEVMRRGEEIVDRPRARWAAQIGEEQLAAVETHLAALVGPQPVRFGNPGRIARDLG